jgi:hypothetical protein
VIDNIEVRWNEATKAWVLRAVTETRAKKEAYSYQIIIWSEKETLAVEKRTYVV